MCHRCVTEGVARRMLSRRALLAGPAGWGTHVATDRFRNVGPGGPARVLALF